MGASFCLTCRKRNNCKEICQKLEDILPKPGSSRLHGEHSFDPNVLDILKSKEIGSRKNPVIYDENWE